MSLVSLIGKHIIITNEKKLTIDDALDICCKTLIEQGKVTLNYLAAIKKKHHEIGPYYVLAPKIAMPHARPEDGVNEACLQLTVFKNGVDLGSENGDVYLAITLAAKDANAHIQTIMTLSKLFQNNDDVASIIAASSIENIVEILRKY